MSRNRPSAPRTLTPPRRSGEGAGARSTIVGVISDTHGVVRPEALRALRDVDSIVHAGDVGSPDVLEALRAIAPVRAVRGNNDRGAWAAALPERLTITAAGVRLLVVHDVHELAPEAPANECADVVIAGHSHAPLVELRDGVLWLNPGSAGPRRFKLPIAVARLTIRNRRASARIVLLEPSP